jgi:hypothetical protein
MDFEKNTATLTEFLVVIVTGPQIVVTEMIPKGGQGLDHTHFN